MPTNQEILVHKLMTEYPALDYLMAETIVLTSHKFYDSTSKDAGQQGEVDIPRLGVAHSQLEDADSCTEPAVSVGASRIPESELAAV